MPRMLTSPNPLIHARQTALLYRNATIGQVSNVVVAIPTAALAYTNQPGAVVWIWLSCMLLVALYRYLLAQRYRAAHPPPAEAAAWTARFLRPMALHSVLWVIGCGATMWGNADPYRFMAVLIVLGLVAGAVPLLSPVKAAFRGFAVPMVVGIALVDFATAAQPVHWLLGGLSLMFLYVVVRSSNHMHSMLLEILTLEQEKSALVDKAQAAARARSEFLANISHEIRTPMNSILGMAQLALRAEHDPRQRDYLTKIQSSGDHLLSIIDDILDLSKIDAGKLAIEIIDFEFAKVMENISTLLAEKAEDKGLKLVFDLDPGIPPYLRGDPLRLSQVLTNLVNNAIKFTEAGKVTVRVEKEPGQDDQLRFEIQDTGIGISQDDMTQLFQPFHQGDSSTTRRFGGTGLGLTICKQLVDMMDNGHIGVESMPGAGSTFWFTARFPLGVRPARHAADAQLEEFRQNEAALLEPIRGAEVLLVDDNALNLDVATTFLEHAGTVVRTASNGAEAIALLRDARFDCVLMDVQMPVMDGLEAVRRIRADPAIADIPVIAMTANVMREDRERYLAAGMSDFIGKPFQYHTLVVTMAKWLSRTTTPVASRGLLAPLAGDPAVIDLSRLAEMIGDDLERLREIAFKFVTSMRNDLVAIEAALERRDLAELGALGHRGKSPAMMVGAVGTARLCEALEHNARSGDLEQAREIVGQLRLLPQKIHEHISGVFTPD